MDYKMIKMFKIINETDLSKKYDELMSKKDNLHWEEYIYNSEDIAKKKNILGRMNTIKEPIKVKIPKKDNLRYRHIESFGEANLSNNLALEMLIRNNLFSNSACIYHEIKHNLSQEEFEQKNKDLNKKISENLRERFGYDSKDEFLLRKNHPYFNEFTSHNIANEYSIINPPFLEDIENGINRLIKYYSKNNKLYLFQPSNSDEFEIIKDADINDFIKTGNNVFVKVFNFMEGGHAFIPKSMLDENDFWRRLDNHFYKMKPTKITLLSDLDEKGKEFIQNLKSQNLDIENFYCIPISEQDYRFDFLPVKVKQLPLEFLDSGFLKTISESEKKNLENKASTTQRLLPTLKLKSSKTISVDFNLDNPEEELIEIVRNLKKNHGKIKSLNEILNIEIEEIIKPNDSKKIAKNKNLRNKDYANAFYIYDLYKIIGREFENKIKALNEEKNTLINEIEQNKHLSNISKKHENDKIIDKFENNKCLYNKKALDDEITSITKLEISKVRALHSLLKEYIEDEKLKSLIL
jgi:hypothetical protein